MQDKEHVHKHRVLRGDMPHLQGLTTGDAKVPQKQEDMLPAMDTLARAKENFVPPAGLDVPGKRMKTALLIAQLDTFVKLALVSMKRKSVVIFRFIVPVEVRAPVKSLKDITHRAPQKHKDGHTCVNGDTTARIRVGPSVLRENMAANED